MRHLAIHQCQAISGGVDFIYAGGLPVPATGISDRCAKIIENAVEDQHQGRISQRQAALKIVNGNCENDFDRFVDNFKKTYPFL